MENNKIQKNMEDQKGIIKRFLEWIKIKMLLNEKSKSPSFEDFVELKKALDKALLE